MMDSDKPMGQFRVVGCQSLLLTSVSNPTQKRSECNAVGDINAFVTPG